MNYSNEMVAKVNSLKNQSVLIDGVHCVVGSNVCQTSDGEKYVYLVPKGGISYKKDLKAIIELLEFSED